MISFTNRALLGELTSVRREWPPPSDSVSLPHKVNLVPEAEAYHREQVETLAGSAADMVCAITMNYMEEALGIARAAQRAGMPVAISFTVETDGNLPTGQSLEAAIERIDDATSGYPCYYMINCAAKRDVVGQSVTVATVDGGADRRGVADVAQGAGRPPLAMRLNPHLHTVFLDGAYHEEGEALVWSELGHLKRREVGEVLEHAVRRMARYLRRHGLLELGRGDAEDEADPEAALAASAVSGRRSRRK